MFEILGLGLGPKFKSTDNNTRSV